MPCRSSAVKTSPCPSRSLRALLPAVRSLTPLVACALSLRGVARTIALFLRPLSSGNKGQLCPEFLEPPSPPCQHPLPHQRSAHFQHDPQKERE